MKAAGMEGSLPLSFGGGPRSKGSRKRKRSHEVEEQVEEQVAGEEDEPAGEEEVGHAEEVPEGDVGGEDEAVEEGGPKVETTIVDKVRVVYDSDGEVSERVVEKIEVVAEMKPEQKSGRETGHKNSANKGAGKKKSKYPGTLSEAIVLPSLAVLICHVFVCAAVPKDVVKFYLQRHILFEKFEEGILLDHESWYSVRRFFLVYCCGSPASD
jgi:trimethylguanosine synthase